MSDCQELLEELHRLKQENAQLKSQMSRQDSHIERYKAREEKRDFFDSICDAADGVTGTLLSGNEKTVIRHLTKAIMFATTRRNKYGAVCINRKRVVEAAGNIQRGDLIIDKVVRMDLFVVDGSEQHEKDELWLIVPTDIIKRLQNISSEFRRGHGSIYCSKCGHSGAPIVRERGHRKLLCECCLYTVSECDFERDIHRGKITKSEKFNEKQNEYLPELKPYRVIPEPEDFTSEWEPEPEEIDDTALSVPEPESSETFEEYHPDPEPEEIVPEVTPPDNIIPFPIPPPKPICPLCGTNEHVIVDRMRGTCYCRKHPRAMFERMQGP